MATLYRKHLESYNPEAADSNDRRRIVAKAVFSYEDKDGVEFRKSFTATKDTPEMAFWDIAPATMECKVNY